MRISDWSSDVCSSDLGVPFALGKDRTELVFNVTFDAPREPGGSTAPVQTGRCTPPSGETVSFQLNDEEGGRAPGVRVFAGLRSDQIGRASCRERVCQYV